MNAPKPPIKKPVEQRGWNPPKPVKRFIGWLVAFVFSLLVSLAGFWLLGNEFHEIQRGPELFITTLVCAVVGVLGCMISDEVWR